MINENHIIPIRDWIIKLAHTFISLLRLLLLSKINKQIKHNPREELVIAGNGPSLNKTIELNIDKLEKKAFLCLNLFCISDNYEKLKPQYYVIVSPNMWGDYPDSRTIQNKEKIWHFLGKKTSWPLDLYLPFEAKKAIKWKQLLGNNNYIKIKYFNRTPIEGFDWFCHYIFKSGLGMPRPHNVIIPSILIGINLGFKKIKLIGADHSWLTETSVNSKNEVLVCQKHFYDENEAAPEGMIKIHKGSRKLHEVLEKWMISFKSYFILKNYANSRKCRIVNGTPKSFIDAFDRELL